MLRPAHRAPISVETSLGRTHVIVGRTGSADGWTGWGSEGSP